MEKTTVMTGISVFSLFLLCVLFQVPGVYSEEFSAAERSLDFLEDVVQLDLTEYNVTLDGVSVDVYPELGNITQEDVLYILESNGNRIIWSCAFRNETFVWGLLDVLGGSPVYSQPQPDVINRTKDLLGRYQVFTGEPDFEGIRDFEGMRNTLDMIDEISDVTVTSGNVKLEVKPTRFKWVYTVNSLEFPLITISFRNDHLEGFGDPFSIYEVGSTDVNISEAEAIDIALNYVENYSWAVGDEEVTDFNVVKETAELETTRWKEPLTLHPWWSIFLYLDKTYPGGVSSIQMAIWADTGEVISCWALGSGGPIPEFPSLLILPLLMLTTLLVAFIYRRKTKSEGASPREY